VWKEFKEVVTRSLEFEDSRRHSIYEISNSKDNFSPKKFWNISGEHEESSYS
jgi:hypothetical protein